jgi:hypothetical protein
LLLAALLSSLPSPLPAQTVPALVNYQGRLANPDGTALPTADYTLTFKLYDAATNGGLVWGPQIFDGAAAQGHGGRVPVVQGWFNVMLGPADTTGAALSDAFTGATRYVEVTVSNRPPIAPRQQILTTPFAFQAANSAKLAGYDWSALLGTNNPVAGTIPFSKLAQRQVGTNVGVGGVAVSASSGTWTITSGSEVPTSVTNLDVSIVTSGRPVMLKLVSDGATNAPADCFVAAQRPSPPGVNGEVTVVLSRDQQAVCYLREVDYCTGCAFMQAAPSLFSHIDFAPEGTHRYTVQVYTSNITTSTIFVWHVRLVAFEL